VFVADAEVNTEEDAVTGLTSVLLGEDGAP